MTPAERATKEAMAIVRAWLRVRKINVDDRGYSWVENSDQLDLVERIAKALRKAKR